MENADLGRRTPTLRIILAAGIQYGRPAASYPGPSAPLTPAANTRRVWKSPDGGLYRTKPLANTPDMSFNHLWTWLFGGLLAALTVWVVSHRLSRDSRLERRRRRNNRRLQPKVNRPMVRLSVRLRKRSKKK